MDELHKRGGKLIYDPQWIVHRRPRRSLKAFIKMLMTYGRGRAEQFRLHPSFGSALNFAPPLFCLYLVALLVFVFVPLNATLTPLKLWAAAPLALYVLFVFLLALASIPSGGVLRSLLATPLLAITNIFYGIGIWRGLFTRLKSPAQSSPPPVILETVSL